jgi:hypothetical protein
MPDTSRDLHDLPPLFAAGVLTNWLGVGLLAWNPQQMTGAAVLLSLGTIAMFVAAYRNRPKTGSRRKLDVNQDPTRR